VGGGGTGGSQGVHPSPETQTRGYSDQRKAAIRKRELGEVVQKNNRHGFMTEKRGEEGEVKGKTVLSSRRGGLDRDVLGLNPAGQDRG